MGPTGDYRDWGWCVYLTWIILRREEWPLIVNQTGNTFKFSDKEQPKSHTPTSDSVHVLTEMSGVLTDGGL